MQTSLDDIINFAYVLTRWSGAGSAQLRFALCSVVLTRAQIADIYRDATGSNHPVYGSGSLKDSCESLLLCSKEKNAICTPPDKRFYRALSTACLAVNGEVTDPTSGATHFHHHLDNPYWSRQQEPKALIGDYFFYGIDDMSVFGHSSG